MGSILGTGSKIPHAMLLSQKNQKNKTQKTKQKPRKRTQMS